MMKKWAILLFSVSSLVWMSNNHVASASEQSTPDSTPLSAFSTNLTSPKLLSAVYGQEEYHSVRFSVDFMETIMAGDSEPRGRFYQALQEAIGAPVIYYDFWNDYIVLKVIDKKITPEEAEVIKAKMNSLDWLYDTYNVPRDQEFITDIYWFDRWS